MRAFIFCHTAEVETHIEAESEEEAREKFANDDYMTQYVIATISDPDISDLGEI